MSARLIGPVNRDLIVQIVAISSTWGRTSNVCISILAAANPIESHWNKSKTIIENIQLPPTLLSRFDLIFLLLDPQDEAYDRRLAQHLASWYQYGKEGESAHEAMVNLSLFSFL